MSIVPLAENDGVKSGETLRKGERSELGLRCSGFALCIRAALWRRFLQAHETHMILYLLKVAVFNRVLTGKTARAAATLCERSAYVVRIY
jgi:hypothetical protein